MKKKTYLFVAGITVTCGTALAIHLSQPKSIPMTKSGHEKMISKSPTNSDDKSRKKDKGIAGIDYPTSDGFKLDKQSKIISKTDTGIIVAHGDHSHFIFYKDLKGTAFAYLIPNGVQITKPLIGDTNESINGHGHHYVFNPKDIVAEDAFGYTVRHDDHFHYILKSSLGMTPMLTNYNQGRHFQRDSHYKPNVQGIPGLDFATSDGFQFDGSGIVGKTNDSILVSHDDHLHPISFDDLRKTGWGEIVKIYEKREIATPLSHVASKEDLVQKTIEYLAKSLALPLSSIEIIKTDDGKIGFKYPHHDHSHVIMLEDIEIGKPIPDPHQLHHAKELEKHRIGMNTLREIGFDEEVILDIVRTHDAKTEFPSNEKNPEKMKEWLTTVTKLDLGSRKDPLNRFGLHLLPNLENLGIGFTPIKNMEPVLQFKKLKRLLMTATGVKNYDFLKYMPNLEGLDISQNNLKDLSFLTPYKQLNLLAAADNQLSTLQPLAELPKLQFLVLSNNKIKDLSPLKNLTRLQEVHIENNLVRDLTPLNDKENLKALNLSENRGVDLKTLRLPLLETLTVNKASLTDLNFFEANPNLTEVTATKNAIQKLDGIEKAKKLQFLDLQENKVNHLNIKEKQESLTFLNLSDNALESLEGVNDFTALETLRVASNKISSLHLEESNQQVKSLDVSYNQLPKEELTLNENDIPLGVAQHFTAVKEGSIEGNPSLNDVLESQNQKNNKKE